MKQKLYITGLINLLVILTGIIFKINHFPGAGILLSLGIAAFVIITVPLSLINSYRNAENGSRLLYIVTGITCLVVFTAMLFKIMHWPFASIMLIIAILFLNIVFLPVFVFITGRKDHFSITNTVSVLFLLAINSVFSALLSLNVTRTVITDSFNVPGSINALKTSLLRLPASAQQSAVLQKIDDVLQVIDQYQQAILTSEGLTEEQWNNYPYSLFRPDARDAVQKALSRNSDMEDGKKLRSALGTLIETAQSTAGYSNLAEAIPYFAGLYDPVRGNDTRTIYFTEDFLTWSLVYLDSLETNLRLLKAVYMAGLQI